MPWAAAIAARGPPSLQPQRVRASGVVDGEPARLDDDLAAVLVHGRASPELDADLEEIPRELRTAPVVRCTICGVPETLKTAAPPSATPRSAPVGAWLRSRASEVLEP